MACKSAKHSTSQACGKRLKCGSSENNNGDNYNGIIVVIIFIIEAPGFHGGMKGQIFEVREETHLSQDLVVSYVTGQVISL